MLGGQRMNKNILLLGGKGFIGTALSEHLYTEEFNVHTPLSLPEIKEALPLCSTVVYLASSGTIENPLIQLEENVAPVINFLNLLKDYEDVHFIFISSGGTIYGTPKTISVDEDFLLTPISFYGASKAATEIFLRVFSLDRNISIARLSNTYGPNQLFESNFSGVIRAMLEHTLNGTPMEVWGDGTVIRDFLYIDDVVSALMSLIYLPYDNSTYNVGTGIGYSINKLKEVIETVCNKELNVIYKSSRKIDVKAITLDSSRFIEKTKWLPLVTLEQGIEFTWKWLKDGEHRT